MLLCRYMFRPYKATFRQHLFKDSNSLHANHIVFLRYDVDVPSYLFDLVELWLFLCHIISIVFMLWVSGVAVQQDAEI
jgi:hypothetical protein